MSNKRNTPSNKRSNTLILTPKGLFNALDASSVTATEKGVAVLNGEGQMINWNEYASEEKRDRICRELSLAVYAAHNGAELEPIQWEDLNDKAENTVND